MPAFHTIAVPHKDILEGRLTMDVFAADLWEVSQGRGPDEYKDPDTFFKKTYLTEGLNNLLAIVERRLHRQGGDPVIQIQTPFGGGKTHALIAMYHKASEWKAKKAVIVGTALSTDTTLWGLLEKQIQGKVHKFSEKVAPGKELLRELLERNQPILILMDEVLEYATKAAAVKVRDSTLASQTIAFMHELTEVAGSLEKVSLVITLPSSILEHYDESAEKLYQQLQKVAGRMEKIYTPVQDEEISKIIRRRLFTDIDEKRAGEIVRLFMNYAEREGILPVGTEPSDYRDKFLDSYPFIPDVINVLYHRWGSFPNFQRTRGVLRLLSLVIYSLRKASQEYITLSDFDLGNQEIRQELLKHIGPEFNSVIAADITDKDSGSKKVDNSLGKAFRGLNLGTRTTRAAFLYSFSGGQEHGATLNEIKRSATTLGNPSSVVAEALEQLKSRLFYIQNIRDKYFFDNQPNLNRILTTKIENVKDDEIISLEKNLLRNSVSTDRLKVFIWEESPSNIPDSEDLKLLILSQENKEIIDNLIKTKGQTPRVNRNTLIFLFPLESERPSFVNSLKRKIAYEYIQEDKNLKLTEEQIKEVKRELKNLENDLTESIRRLYRIVALPSRDGLKVIDLGIPTYGEAKGINKEVYEKLRSEGEILENVAALVIKEKYLRDKEFVLTEQIYQSSLKTPGESRVVAREAIERGFTEGVRAGLFGIGELENDKPVCRFYKEEPSIAFAGNEVLISEAICKEQQRAEKPPEGEAYPEAEPGIPERGREERKDFVVSVRDKIHLKFSVPKGKVSNIMGVMNLLQSKFDNLEIELIATDGAISDQDYEDKIKETFRQLGIELGEE